MPKVALVTGAGSGIGREVALRLSADGFEVFVAGRRADPLKETAAMAKPAAGSVKPVPTDISRVEDVKALFSQIYDQAQRIDFVFNNAGMNIRGAIDEISVEDWLAVVSTNLTGTFLVAREAFCAMKAQTPQGGRIVNNGSVSAQVPRPGTIAYTATKHAITGLTRSLSLDGREFNIACGQIDVGNVATDMSKPPREGIRQADGSIRAEPMMHGANVAEAVALMAKLPLDANVQFMTIMATTMPFIGRG